MHSYVHEPTLSVDEPLSTACDKPATLTGDTYMRDAYISQYTICSTSDAAH